MGRLGIRYEQVVEKAEAILTMGQNPTIEKVRRALGDTGSNSHIGQYLREWKADRMQNVGEGTSSPLPLPDPLLIAMTQVWEKVRAESEAENARIQTETQIAITQAQKDRIEAEQQANTLQEQLEKAQLKINHLETDLQLVRSELIEQKQERAVFQERAQQSEQRLEDLKKGTEKRITELEQSQHDVISQLKQQLEKETQFYKQELNDLKTHAENQRHRFIAEIDQLRTAKDKAEKAHLQAAIELKNQLQTNKVLTEQLKFRDTDVKMLQQQYNDGEKQQAFLHAEVAQKECFLAELKEQLVGARAKLEEAREYIGELKTLTNKTHKIRALDSKT